MTKRENLLSLLRRKGYEHVPVEFVLCPSLEKLYKEKTKSELPYEEYFGFSWARVDDRKLAAIDSGQYKKYFEPPIKDDATIDEWGVGHEPSPNSMHMTYMRHPLKNMQTLQELEAYNYPDYKNADDSHQKAQADAIKAKGLAALGDMQMSIWEAAWYMRSMEELMMDMMAEDEKADFILDKVLEISILRAQSFVKAGVDILFLGDDIGMQSTAMMSDELYCTWLKPRLKKLIEAAKAINPDVIIFYHSCGFVEPFIKHLIDVGVDVLNPIQSESMDVAKILNEYGERISFHGTIGTQSLMPFGTPEEIKKTVCENLDIMGKKGGLYVAPTHMLEPEVPWENILAYVQACKEYKKSSL